MTDAEAPLKNEGPGCPADLSTDAKAEWRRIREHMKRRGDWLPIYGYVVDLFCRAHDRAEDARALLKAGGYESTGMKGQPVQSPHLKTLRDAELDKLKALQALRLTPQELAKGPQAETKPPTGGKFGGAFD